VVVDATYVYWVNRGAVPVDDVRRVPKSGGPTIILATAQNDYGQIEDLAVDATHVYWTTEYKVMRTPIGGGAPSIVAITPGPAWGVSVDDTHIYFSDYTAPGVDGHVYKTAK
jgi:hypothetical protein